MANTARFQTNSRKAIGWDGKRLKQMLDESERLFGSTDRYYGLESLPLKEKDPIRYQRIYARLRGSLVNARESSVMLSANPQTVMGEICFGLYSPEGDSITFSTGIIVHVHTMSDAIKFMVRNEYEENPTIRPGDIFTNNEPLVCGNVQTADVQTIIPIFVEDEIVGWAAGVTHEVDIGASTPGSDPVGPLSRYDGGIVIPCEKVGENDTLYKYYELRCKLATRTPTYWVLDEKTRLAGCFMIRDAVHKIISEEGLETYKELIRELIEEGRRTFIDRIKTMTIPGKYNAASFMDLPMSQEASLPEFARKDWLMHLPIEIVISEDGKFSMSFDGASTWIPNQVNGSPTTWQGGLWISIAQTLMATEMINDGAYLATSGFFPHGSWAWPNEVSAGTGMSWYPLYGVFTGLYRALGRAFQARGYVEEVLTGYGATVNEMQGGILAGKADAYGRPSAFLNWDLACTGHGAGLVKDGLDFASSMWNPEGDMDDVEVVEQAEIPIYLSRKIKPNTAGAGKYRGGSGLESLRMPWKNNDLYMQFTGNGKVLISAGLFGGYPAAAGYRLAVHRTDLLHRFENHEPYPQSHGDPDYSDFEKKISGEIVCDKRALSLLEPFYEGDLYLNYIRGGPGCGDPLERDADKVAEDVHAGYITQRFAEGVYGIVTEHNGDTYVVNAVKSKRKRDEIRARRAERGIKVSEWYSKERERVLKKDLIEPVREMYRSSMALSPKWAATFRSFWNLPDNFSF